LEKMAKTRGPIAPVKKKEKKFKESTDRRVSGERYNAKPKLFADVGPAPRDEKRKKYWKNDPLGKHSKNGQEGGRVLDYPTTVGATRGDRGRSGYLEKEYEEFPAFDGADKDVISSPQRTH